MLQEFIAPAVSFGISATVMPGPLIAFLVNTTLTHGWRKAMLVVWALLITDAPIIFLMTFLLGQLPADILKLIELGGGILLLIIAWGAYKQFRNASVLNLPADVADDSDTSGRRILLTGIMVNFLSPGPWLFWATVNGPLLVKALGESVAHAAVFMLAFSAPSCSVSALGYSCFTMRAAYPSNTCVTSYWRRCCCCSISASAL